MIVVDRIDLDTQITATFNAADVPNMVGVATRQELQTLLGAGRAQGAHHHHSQVRRGGRQVERAVEHHRDGGRGAPHAGRRSRPQDARGAAKCVPLRPDRHADQSRRPEYVLGVRRGRGREGLHEPLLVPGIHPGQGHAAAAFRGAGGEAEDRQGGHRRSLPADHRQPERAGPRRPCQSEPRRWPCW